MLSRVRFIGVLENLRIAFRFFFALRPMRRFNYPHECLFECRWLFISTHRSSRLVSAHEFNDINYYALQLRIVLIAMWNINYYFRFAFAFMSLSPLYSISQFNLRRTAWDIVRVWYSSIWTQIYSFDGLAGRSDDIELFWRILNFVRLAANWKPLSYRHSRHCNRQKHFLGLHNLILVLIVVRCFFCETRYV